MKFSFLKNLTWLLSWIRLEFELLTAVWFFRCCSTVSNLPTFYLEKKRVSLRQSPFSLPWQKVIWQNFAIGLWQCEKPKPRPQVLRRPILSENCGFYVYFLVKSWGINVKLINNLPRLIKVYYFFKRKDRFLNFSALNNVENS